MIKLWIMLSLLSSSSINTVFLVSKSSFSATSLTASQPPVSTRIKNKNDIFAIETLKEKYKFQSKIRLLDVKQNTNIANNVIIPKKSQRPGKNVCGRRT